MATFSWGDTARAAFATCFACFPQWRRAPEEDEEEQTNASSSRRDELESLLQSTEYSDAEMDNDAVSLHSDVGNSRRRDSKRHQQRRRRRGRKNKGTIRLFGYDLFGKAVRADSDGDDQSSDVEREQRRRLARLSSSTLDSDPAPVEDDIIARLSAGQASQVQEEPEAEAEATAAAAKKAVRKEKKRQRKLSSALLNAERTAEFEGFQGSGDDVTTAQRVQFSQSSVLPTHDEFGEYQEARSVNDNSSRASNEVAQVAGGGGGVEDEADMHADFDAVAYVRRNSIASRSDSGSGSRSHTSMSISRSEANVENHPRQSQGNNKAQLHLRPPSLQDLRQDMPSPPSALLDVKPSKRTRRSTTSGPGANPRLSVQPRRSRRSTTAGSSTSTATSSQPRSPDTLSSPDVHIVRPLDNHLRIPQHNPAFEGVPEDDGEFTASPLSSSFKSPSNMLPSPVLSKGFPSPGLSGFPSPGFGGRRNSSATASGVFLARTGDD